MPRVILLTSTFLRHWYVAHVVAEHLDLVGVWQEEKTFQPEKYAENPHDLAVITKHFADRDASEHAYFGTYARVPFPSRIVHRSLSGTTINDSREVAEMVALHPDVVLVYGTGILHGEILDAFAGRIVNIHLGLSPYYRGSGTNFWPLVNREPEYVGATIHYIDAGIDTGPIIAHVCPEVMCEDGPHDLGNKTIIAAAHMLCQAAEAHASGMIHAVPQSRNGRLYQRKDFTAAAVRQLYENFATGMLEEYLQHQVERDAHLRLVTLPSLTHAQ